MLAKPGRDQQSELACAPADRAVSMTADGAVSVAADGAGIMTADGAVSILLKEQGL